MNEKLMAEQERLIQEGGGYSLYLLAKDNPDAGINIREVERVVIEKNDSDTAYLLAKDVVGVDTKAMEQVVMAHGISFDKVRFARQIPGADIKALERSVIDSGDGHAALQFARTAPGANINALETLVIEQGTTEVGCAFAHHVPTANLKRLEQFIIEKGTVMEMIYMASTLSQRSFHPDFDAIMPIVIERGNGREICRFAEKFFDEHLDTEHDQHPVASRAAIKTLGDTILKRGDVPDMVWFVENIPGIDMRAARERFSKIRDKDDRLYALDALDSVASDLVEMEIETMRSKTDKQDRKVDIPSPE